MSSHLVCTWLDALSTGLVVPFDVVRKFELPPARRITIRILQSSLDQVGILERFQLPQCLALIVTHVPKEGDVQCSLESSALSLLVFVLHLRLCL